MNGKSKRKNKNKNSISNEFENGFEAATVILQTMIDGFDTMQELNDAQELMLDCANNFIQDSIEMIEMSENIEKELKKINQTYLDDKFNTKNVVKALIEIAQAKEQLFCNAQEIKQLGQWLKQVAQMMTS